MKVTFPHMGNMYICLKALLEYLDVDVVVPPSTSKRTLTMGVQHSPEFACLPLKVNLGNFMEAHELGADTVLMAGGIGPCRFGYYAQVQREILRDLGYNYDMVVLEPPQKHISELLVKIKHVTGNRSWVDIVRAIKFAWHKARAVDAVEMEAQKLRAREMTPGSVDIVYKKGLADIDAAKNKKELDDTVLKTMCSYKRVPVDHGKKVLKIGIVGEIYVLLEPFVNLDVERHLGRLGVEITRSIYLSEWINDHLFMGLIKGVKGSKAAKETAPPYINHFIGGHGQESIGNTILYARSGYDGVIQVAPFTCMPEIVAESVLPRVSREHDIPTFTLIVDEHSGDAGVLTRLEAFVDLLARKKNSKEGETVCADI
ncbi:MAG: CoA protein activase [Bacillota bacterium]